MTGKKGKNPVAGDAALYRLGATEARYRALMEHANDAIIMGDVEQGVVIDVNARACEMLGLSRDEFIGMPVMDMHPPELRQRYSELFREYVAAGGSNSVELIMRHRDGSDIPVSVSVAVVEVDGRRIIQGIFRDIRDIKKAELQMREETRFRETLIESAAEGICLWQRSRDYPFVRFSIWNQRMQEITGYSMQQINELGWYQTLYALPEAQEKARQRMAMVEAGGRVRGLESRIVTSSGEERILRISSAPVTGEGQTWVLAVMEDITEQRALEANLRQAQKIEALGTLVGGIAHDFNNILTGMLGNIYLAQTDAELPAGIMEYLIVAEDMGYRAADLISQMLTFARKGRFDMQRLELNRRLGEAFDKRLLMAPENIRLAREFCAEELPVLGDLAQIEQVLMNLLGNARDALAGRPDPGITVRLERFEPDAHFRSAYPGEAAGAYARLSVEDNGVGIAPQHLERIFEPFFTTKDVGSGTGLGLAMAYTIVQRHGGLIEVESTEGVGTAFRIYLPLIDSADAAQGTDEGGYVRGQGETILLADDEPEVLHSMSEVIGRLGYQVLAAADGEQAWTLFRAHRSDIVLAVLDVVMPGINGTEVAQRIRRVHPRLPIIFITGYDSGGDLGLLGGERTRVLAKPFRIDELSREIRTLLGQTG
ncbi:MAG TPA: PAS domain S-box protein [Mariprofundaceae bacterium]|nr:PAS domain S-box protein [Mariprofundaceae bacterium]